MPTVHCFTSITFSYLGKARLLAWSLKRFHPDWTFSVCITDREPDGFRFDLAREPFDRVIWADELPIANVNGWLFKHDVVEACTAVKGPVLAMLADSGEADRIIYLDPDIAVFAPLEPILEQLDAYDVVLTPHQLEPDVDDQAVVDNEIGSLQHGAFNLGFLGVRTTPQGRRFAAWWRRRLEDHCYADIPAGLFVDQRWCDLAPSLFEGVGICRDPGCNVASWNLSRRPLVIDERGELLARGARLRFYHFTKIEGVGADMVSRYAGESSAVFELIAWYNSWLAHFTSPEIPRRWWRYGSFNNGVPVLPEHRRLYRTRRDLQLVYPDPFRTDGHDCYLQWLNDHPDEWEAGEGLPQNQSAAPIVTARRRGSTRRARWAEPCRRLVGRALACGITEVNVFGAGDVGRTFLEAARVAGLAVRQFVDSNPLLWGQTVDGVRVGSLADAMACQPPAYVVGSFAFTEEIERRIRAAYEGTGVDVTIISNLAEHEGAASMACS